MHPFDHPSRTTNIGVGAKRLPVQQILQRDRLTLIVVVDMHLVGELPRQLIHIRPKALGAARVVQLPIAVVML